MKTTVILATVVALGGLAACGEKPQAMAGGKHAASAAWKGTGTAFAAPGWTAGDKASWDGQIKSRAMGQNENTRIGAGS